MCVSKVKHMTGRKTGCNRSRPVFFGFLIFQQTSQLATEKIQNLCNRNQWSGLLQLGSVRFRSFFQSSKLDLRTLFIAHNFSSKITLATVLMLLFSTVENTDLLNLHQHQQNPQLSDEKRVNLSSWLKSLAHEVEKQTPKPKFKTLFKQSENMKSLPEN